jgi:hypothetical protein
MQVKDHTNIDFSIYTMNYIRSSDILPKKIEIYLKNGFEVLGCFKNLLSKYFVAAPPNKVAGAFHKQEMVSRRSFR